MTRILTIVALGALLVPAAFAAPPTSSPSPAQACKQQLATMGAAGFASMYAPANPKSAMGKCVSKAKAQAQADAANAAKSCKADMAMSEDDFKAANDGKTFSDLYGKGKNAYGKCVSAKAKQSAAARQAAVLNAAKACKAERAGWNAAEHEGKTFAQHYGTNKNLKNAFGKCVSAKAKAKGDA